MKQQSTRTRIRKGDLVRVIAGKEKGKQGEILNVVLEKQAAFVESLNMVKRATKPSQGQEKGGIVEREGRIHLSNLMLVCRSCSKITRIGKKLLPDGKKLRICKHCGDALDKEA